MPKPFKSTRSRGGKKSGKSKSKSEQQPQPPPPPTKQEEQYEKVSMITRIMEVIIEAADPIGVNTAVGNHIEDPNIGEGDNKTITGTNTKATADNLIPSVEAIIIITMAIIEAEVVVAMEETISDLAVIGEAIIKAIIITNTINITHMMMDHRLNNMAHHVHFVVVLIILLNIALKENITLIISQRK